MVLRGSHLPPGRDGRHDLDLLGRKPWRQTPLRCMQRHNLPGWWRGRRFGARQVGRSLPGPLSPPPASSLLPHVPAAGGVLPRQPDHEPFTSARPRDMAPHTRAGSRRPRAARRAPTRRACGLSERSPNVPTAELETVAGVGRECRAGGEGAHSFETFPSLSSGFASSSESFTCSP